MKRLLFLSAFIISLFDEGALFAQLKKPALADSLFSTYYHQRVTHFKTLPQTKGDIIFLGNSITDGAEWSELFGDLHLKNRGISGDVTAGVIHRLDEVAKRKPAKVFLLIGTNDLARKITTDSVMKNIFWITDYLNQETPTTKIYVQSIFPVNNAFGKFAGHTVNSAVIQATNSILKQQAADHHYTYIDLHPALADKDGKLNKDFTNDGLHLAGSGYLLWKHIVYPYVYDLNKHPSLLPLPQKLQWTNEVFPLFSCREVYIKNNSLNKEASYLQQQLTNLGLQVILQEVKPQGVHIELSLSNIEAPGLKEEAYHLQVGASKILLEANSAHGIFNGLQTLMQLARNRVMINGCEITDWPSFEWRGYMVDVGRNYMSPEMLKQQIEVMSRYKLNVFHFHFTEDIAWRLASNQFPQLTQPQHMLRNKGQYYSEAELKDLIAFCNERHITLVPEIDMPGHSAAFKRAMGFDMQSDSGMLVLKNIIREFMETYNLPYFHIGADEVKITNKNFVPEITAYVQGFGKKVIGWEPGGNFTDNTIRQMWMDDNGKIAGNANIQYIDSRHLYINHMDPLEAVVTLFNRKISEKEKGDANALGAELCLWHDRAVGKEDDMLQMNPVYPGILAFAERVWRGGGNSGWTAVAGVPSSKEAIEFAAFEERLTDHQKQYFAELPFPYRNQSSSAWKLFGPYANKGDVSREFAPEQKNFDPEKAVSAREITGGTVVLRHWWYPLIKGAIDKPEENSTWYAYTKIWSDNDVVKNFWIGFNNLSRSPATDSPPAGMWDTKGSKIWVNGELLPAPNWKRGGQKGNSEIPLTDEGYEYRKPASVKLNKGWNYVLVKLPVTTFKGKDWQNPVKWMFTFIEAPAGNCKTE